MRLVDVFLVAGLLEDVLRVAALVVTGSDEGELTSGN